MSGAPRPPDKYSAMFWHISGVFSFFFHKHNQEPVQATASYFLCDTLIDVPLAPLPLAAGPARITKRQPGPPPAHPARRCPSRRPSPSLQDGSRCAPHTLSHRAPAANWQHGPTLQGPGGCVPGWESLARSRSLRAVPRSPRPGLAATSYTGKTWLRWEEGPGGIEASLGLAGSSHWGSLLDLPTSRVRRSQIYLQDIRFLCSSALHKCLNFGFVPHPRIPAASSFDPCQSQLGGRGERAPSRALPTPAKRGNPMGSAGWAPRLAQTGQEPKNIPKTHCTACLYPAPPPPMLSSICFGSRPGANP